MAVSSRSSSMSVYSICAVFLLISSNYHVTEAARLIRALRSKATLPSLAIDEIKVSPSKATLPSLKTDEIKLSPSKIMPMVSTPEVIAAPADEKPVPSSYIMTSCEPGDEKSLKGEVARNHPSLRLAFSRPGYVTFKLPPTNAAAESEDAAKMAAASFKLNAVFARQFAASLGNSVLIDDVIVKAKALLALDSDPSKRLRLHVWGRGEPMPAAGHPLAIGAAKMRVNQIRELLLNCDEADSIWMPCHDAGSAAATASDSSSTSDDSRDMAKDGDHVFDVIVPTGPFISEPFHIGHHFHFSPLFAQQMIGHSAWPGGNPRVFLPQEAPSRAYLKIEEGLRWSGVNLKGGDTAVEIGSAPGGASYALLKRGLTVVGIDPCPQDRQHNSIVSMHPKFTHLRMRLSGVKRNQLPAQVEWLLCDANISPHSALPHLTDLINALSVGGQEFCGMFLTVKLGDTAEPIPVILQRVKDIGKGIFTSIGATHLPSNGQEICVVALTAQGVARRNQQ